MGLGADWTRDRNQLVRYMLIEVMGGCHHCLSIPGISALTVEHGVNWRYLKEFLQGGTLTDKQLEKLELIIWGKLNESAILEQRGHDALIDRSESDQ